MSGTGATDTRRLWLDLSGQFQEVVPHVLPIAAALEQDCHCDALKRVGPDGRKEGERVSEEPLGSLGLLALCPAHASG